MTTPSVVTFLTFVELTHPPSTMSHSFVSAFYFIKLQGQTTQTIQYGIDWVFRDN